MATIYTAIAVFGLAAILGMYLISLVFRDKATPKGVAIIHGLFAALGLVLLIIYCIGNTPAPIESLVIFCIAALGGFVLFYKDLTGKIPKWLAVVHGLAAVTGYVLLLIFAFS